MTAPQGPATATATESSVPPPAIIEDVSTSSDEETPWDQRRSPDSASVDSSTFLAQKVKQQSAAVVTPDTKQETSNNETSETDNPLIMTRDDPDDRPQTPTRAGWLLRTGLPQQRPLQPPSLRGLTARERIAAATPSESEVHKQWNFWSQLDEDGPDDEVAAMQSKGEAAKRRNRQSMDRTLGHDHEGEMLEQQSTAEETVEYSMDGSKGKDGGAADFCGGTLTAINEMCGGGLAQTGSTEGQKKKRRTAVPLQSDDQQEYTAIEVEFVEANAPSNREDPPEQDSRAVPDALDVLSEDDEEEERTQPNGKRAAFLSALARKAKADFDLAKTARQKMETHEAIEKKHSTDSVEEDIYASFTASEKRKFLKLINTGHAPMEASRKIMEARAEKEAAQQKKKEQAAYRKTRRNKRLAFWKKNRPKSTVPMPSPSYSRSGDELEAAEDPAYDDNDHHEDEFSESEEEADVTETKADDMIPEAAMSAMIALDTKTPRPMSPAMVRATSAGDKSDEERFARSGINYYDAVRRETSDTDDDFGKIGTAAAVTSSEKKKRRMRPRGFSALREGVRSKSVPKPRIPESMFEEAHSTPASNVGSPTIVPSKSSDPAVESSVPASGNDGASLAPAHPTSQADTESSRASSLPVPMRLDLGLSVDEETSTPAASGRGVNGGESRTRSRVVADVGKKTKIGKEDEDMLARIEREILRASVPPKSSELVPAAKSPTKFRSASTPKMRPRGDKELLTKEEKKQDEIQLNLDVGLDTYMQAAAVYSAVHNDSETPHNDATSVYTAGTSGTQSRRRRPGAAKTRLAKAKELYEMQSAKKKGMGWHESIQAAAAGTGRVWKPGTGWVDYVDTPEQGLAPSSDGDRIELNLAKALSKKESADIQNRESSVVPVPFPKDWEAEREQMLAAGESTPKKWPMDSNSRRAVIQDDMGVEQLVEPMDVLADIPQESVQLSEKPRRNRRKSSPARSRVPQQEKATGWVASMQAATAALNHGGKSWSAENGWSVPEEEQGLMNDVVDFSPPMTQEPIDVLRDSPPPTPDPQSRGPDGKLTQWVEKSGRVAKPESSSAADMSMSERAVASGASLGVAGAATDGDTHGASSGARVDPYVQISETGAVRSHKLSGQDSKRGTQSGDDEARAPSDRLGAFPTANDLPASAVVDIQKINEEDLNLFPEESREKRALQARTPPRVKSPAIGGRSPPAVTPASSGESSRRGRGPVDMDEVDDTWDSDDDNRFSLGWDSKSGSNSVNSKPTPSPSKAIPKLKGSKRDTSPIRAHRLTERPGPESDVLSDISTSKPDMNDRDLRRPSAGGADVKSRSRAWESRAGGGPPEWPNEPNEASHEDRRKPVAEWKSFMGKKVSAETEAASQQRARDQIIQGSRSEDEDSLFTFEEKKQSNVSPRDNYKESASPLEARMYPRDHLKDGEDNPESDVYGSEGYGPTPQDGRTFLQRLTECAAPVVASAKNTVGDLPSAHLAFMKNGQFSPAKSLGCGKADDLDDEEEDLVEPKTTLDEKLKRSSLKSSPKSRRAGSSVASEDFGAKTAYLEAIAMKAAVSKPRRTSSRAGGSSVASSSAASNHSEKWKSFLERKKASGVSPGKGRPSSHVSDVSKAAERYAASKVEEMMAEMNADPASSPHGRRETVSSPQHSDHVDDDYRALHSYRSRESRGTSRVGAAEDLAAARVEAMMTQLSGGVEMEEGEI